MGISVFPASGGSPIKSIQRGQAVSAGNVTITAIDTSKSFVISFSQGSAGTVATNSTVAGYSGSFPQTNIGVPSASFDRNSPGVYYWSSTGATPSGLNGQNVVGVIPGRTISNNSAGISGGTMDATTKQMCAYILNSTTITVTGACRWEVVEYN